MYSNYFGGPVGLGAGVGALVALAVVWTLIWKGLALWKSARLGHKWWFIALMIINTLGILEILYIYVFSKKMRSAPVAHIHEHHHDHEHNHEGPAGI